MAIIHCTKDYHRFKIDEQFSFANLVQNGIYTNPTVFANPPVAENDFIALRNNFGTARANYVTYGTTQKTTFKNSQNNLIHALDQLADYVTKLANNDVSMIMLSGFTPSKSKQNKKQAPQKKPTCKVERSGTLGELLVTIEIMEDSRHHYYFLICSEGKELKKLAFTNGTLVMEETEHRVFYNYTKSRNKILRGLIPGVYYYIYVFVSNANGVSQLSQPIKIMAT
jgi:hypothetical protein